MANTGKSELTSLEIKEYDELVGRVAAMPAAQRELTLLSAIEASVMLKISIGTLDRARSKRRQSEQAGEVIPPISHASIPFVRAGNEGPVQYLAQDIVDFLTRLRDASRSPAASIGLGAVAGELGGIRCWMAEASAADTWPFSIQHSGRPIDFMDALSQGVLTGDARRLTLREFGNLLADAAAAQFRAAEGRAIENVSDAGYGNAGLADLTFRKRRDSAL
jgi:hypothetical protein